MGSYGRIFCNRNKGESNMVKGFFKTLFITGGLFGFFMGSLFGIMTQSLLVGFILGIITGLAFGITLSIFVQRQSVKFQGMREEVTKGKPVVMDGGANHFLGAEAVGGWIYLTSDEMIFISHAYNVQKHQLNILLEQIVSVKSDTTLGLIKNRLQIETKDGSIEKFVVNNLRDWIKQLNHMMEQQRSITQDKIS